MLLTADRYDDMLIFVVRAKDAGLYSSAEFFRFACVMKKWVTVPIHELKVADIAWARRLEGDFIRHAKKTTQELTAMASLASRAGTELPSAVVIYVIYDNTTDVPGRFVVRRGEVRSGAPGSLTFDRKPTALCANLKEARGAVPVGLVCLPRHPKDDACIVESWM